MFLSAQIFFKYKAVGLFFGLPSVSFSRTSRVYTWSTTSEDVVLDEEPDVFKVMSGEDVVLVEEMDAAIATGVASLSVGSGNDWEILFFLNWLVIRHWWAFSLVDKPL